MTALERVLDALTAVGATPRGGGRQYYARCPAHDDHNPSLSITAGDDRVLLKCHADCDTEIIVAAVNLTVADLFNEQRHSSNGRVTVVAEYPYLDEHGKLLYIVQRRQPKTFRPKRPDGTGGWIWNMHGVRRVLYHLPEVLDAALHGKKIYVVEGEKDADRLTSLGHVATCNVGGAGKWRDEYAHTLTNANVVVIADADDKGRAHAATVTASLRAAGAQARLVEPAAGCKDVTDHLDAGHSLDDLIEPPPTDPPIFTDLVQEFFSRHPQEMDDLLAEEDEPYDWAVIGLLEHGDRLILTGEEGHGKSTLLRQIGVQLAAGTHPFTLQPVQPLGVLIIDLENSRKHVKREIRKIRPQAKDYTAIPGLHIICHPEGMDLYDDETAGPALLELIRQTKPDILIIGPLYKLVGGDPSEEGPAKIASSWLDRIRTEIGCAVLLEAHSPHATQGQKRPRRPYGASLWKRWPEFGIWLDETGLMEHWRGARDEREWPVKLQRGGTWPWTIATTIPAEFRPTVLMERISRELEREGGNRITKNQLEKLVPGNNPAKRTALNILIDEKYVLIVEEGRSHLVRPLRPYRQTEDPNSDIYRPGEEENEQPRPFAQTSPNLAQGEPPEPFAHLAHSPHRGEVDVGEVEPASNEQPRPMSKWAADAYDRE